MRRNPKADRLALSLAKTAMAIGRRFADSAWSFNKVVAIALESEPEPLFVAIEHSVPGTSQACLMRGSESLAIHGAIALDRIADDHPLVADADFIVGGTEIFGRLPQEAQWLQLETGGPVRRETIAPCILARSGHRPRRSDLRVFLAAMRALLAAADDPDLVPASVIDLERVPTIVAVGDPMTPEVSVEVRSHQAATIANVHMQAGFSDPLLAHWKNVDRAVMRMISKRLNEHGFLDLEPLEEFFGEDHRDWLGGPQRDVAFFAYSEWFARDHRFDDDSPTVLEEILEDGGLDDEERSLIEQRLAVEVSIYRVESIVDDETIEVSCIFNGRRHELRERGLSSTVEPGICLPLRIVRAGPFEFPLFTGPPLPAFQVDRAIDHVESIFGEAPECFESDPTSLGVLFDFCRHAMGVRPGVTNTDGEILAPQEAVFEVSDPSSVRRALDGITALEREPADDDWHWFREAGEDGQRMIRGRIWFESEGELRVSVNSDERMQQALTWLTPLPGLGDPRIERQDMEAFWAEASAPTLRDGDGDDAPEDDASPPLQEALRDLLHRRNMAWLDERIPALDMMTPREAVRTPAGRRKVEHMIRSMPNPVAQIPYEVPREEMLRELGLD